MSAYNQQLKQTMLRMAAYLKRYEFHTSFMYKEHINNETETTTSI
jgi:hypothetical protein